MQILHGLRDICGYAEIRFILRIVWCQFLNLDYTQVEFYDSPLKFFSSHFLIEIPHSWEIFSLRRTMNFIYVWRCYTRNLKLQNFVVNESLWVFWRCSRSLRSNALWVPRLAKNSGSFDFVSARCFIALGFGLVSFDFWFESHRSSELQALCDSRESGFADFFSRFCYPFGFSLCACALIGCRLVCQLDVSLCGEFCPPGSPVVKHSLRHRLRSCYSVPGTTTR